jgi:negative regulator of sigma E activity
LPTIYKVRQEGTERVAGVEADIVLLVPRDSMRFGYRVWTEQKKGLVVKLQTLDTDGKVLEQAAFSELQLDAPVKMDKLLQMMGKVDGYRVEKPVLVKTTASAEGWLLKAPVAGFKPMSCYKRPATAQPAGTAPARSPCNGFSRTGWHRCRSLSSRSTASATARNPACRWVLPRRLPGSSTPIGSP